MLIYIFYTHCRAASKVVLQTLFLLPADVKYGPGR